MPTVQWIDLWEGSEHDRWPGRMVDGCPTFGFRLAPPGLATKRQLRAEGLNPGGREPFAKLVWKRGRRFAWLYVRAFARHIVPASPAKLASLLKAMTARQTCAAGHVADHCVRKSDQLCGDHAVLADQHRGWVVAA
ncbi:RRQRL motif-containing zinc-binding protein [Kribbella sp. NPDC056345]|uniref:RRQRL motif-containing zinc-binding protein n=1 Tax=Kribbella sp. NPDC056345 TaxID=3345789 RepID=UPI0035DF2A18